MISLSLIIPNYKMGKKPLPTTEGSVRVKGRQAWEGLSYAATRPGTQLSINSNDHSLCLKEEKKIIFSFMNDRRGM